MARKRRQATSRVSVSFMRANPSKTKGGPGKLYVAQTFQQQERELVDCWMEIIPEGRSPIEWYRAWQDGYPDEADVEIYNTLHPNEQIELEEG
jgi:hypothetical protein